MTEQVAHSTEDKFFGVSTTIEKSDAPAVKVVKDDDETKIEIIDDAPAVKAADEDDELSNYSEKVQKRINKMTYEKNEERRQREAAERMREEAVKVAQQLAQKNQYYENLINSGEGVLVNQAKSRAELALQVADEKFRKAHENGDTDALVAAQRAMVQAQGDLRDSQRYDADYQQRAEQFRQHQAYQQQLRQQPAPQAPQIPQPTERAKKWAQDNPWFGQHKDMTALAYGVHERLVRDEGVQPDTDEYFEKVNAAMHTRFPEYFGKTKAQPSTVVASVQRNNGAQPRTVQLTATQAALAKRLGLTLEQYAKQLIKGQ